MMVVPDTLADSRFQQSQFVAAEPFVRFYAGAPLVRRLGLVGCQTGGQAGRGDGLFDWVDAETSGRGVGGLLRAVAQLLLCPDRINAVACCLAGCLTACLQVSSEGQVMGSLGMMDVRPRAFPAGVYVVGV